MDFFWKRRIFPGRIRLVKRCLDRVKVHHAFEIQTARKNDILGGSASVMTIVLLLLRWHVNVAFAKDHRT